MEMENMSILVEYLILFQKTTIIYILLTLAVKKLPIPIF